MRMIKALIVVVVVLIIAFLAALFVPSQVSGVKAGSPDISFNPPDGYVLFGNAEEGRDRGVEVAIQDDGKIVALGYSNNSINEDLLIVRYNADGSPDRNFGNGGVLLYDGGGNDRGLGLALQEDGKIVATGFTYAGSQRDVILLRYDIDGMPDTTFGNGGVVTYSSSGSATDIGFGVAVMNDGRIVVVGETSNVTNQDAIVLCYTATGSPDTKFGNGGVFNYGGPGMDRGFAAAIQEDGKIVVAGSTVANTKDDVLVFRLDTDGTVDKTFGENGTATFSGAGDYSDYGNCVSVRPDGKIVVTGAESDGSAFDVLLLQYNPDGSPDTTFGSEGAVIYGSPGGKNDYVYSHVIQPDGRIVVVGFMQDGTDYNVLLLRFGPEGEPDMTFGSNGVVTWNGLGNNTDYGQGIALQSDGRIVVTGFSNNGTDEDLLIMRFIQ